MAPPQPVPPWRRKEDAGKDDAADVIAELDAKAAEIGNLLESRIDEIDSHWRQTGSSKPGAQPEPAASANEAAATVTPKVNADDEADADDLIAALDAQGKAMGHILESRIDEIDSHWRSGTTPVLQASAEISDPGVAIGGEKAKSGGDADDLIAALDAQGKALGDVLESRIDEIDSHWRSGTTPVLQVAPADAAGPGAAAGEEKAMSGGNAADADADDLIAALDAQGEAMGNVLESRIDQIDSHWRSETQVVAKDASADVAVPGPEVAGEKADATETDDIIAALDAQGEEIGSMLESRIDQIDSHWRNSGGSKPGAVPKSGIQAKAVPPAGDESPPSHEVPPVKMPPFKGPPPVKPQTADEEDEDYDPFTELPTPQVAAREKSASKAVPVALPPQLLGVPPAVAAGLMGGVPFASVPPVTQPFGGMALSGPPPGHVPLAQPGGVVSGPFGDAAFQAELHGLVHAAHVESNASLANIAAVQEQLLAAGGLLLQVPPQAPPQAPPFSPPTTKAHAQGMVVPASGVTLEELKRQAMSAKAGPGLAPLPFVASAGVALPTAKAQVVPKTGTAHADVEARAGKVKKAKTAEDATPLSDTARTAASWLQRGGAMSRMDAGAELAKEYFKHPSEAGGDRPSKKLRVEPSAKFAASLLEKAPTLLQTCRSLLLFLNKRIDRPKEAAPQVGGPHDLRARLEAHADIVGRLKGLRTGGWDARGKRVLDIGAAVSSAVGKALLDAAEKRSESGVADLEKDLKERGEGNVETLTKERRTWAEGMVRLEWYSWCACLLRTREAAILAEGGKEVKEAEATEATAAKDNKEGKNADGASRNSVDGALGPVDILEALLNGGSGLRPSRAGG